MQHGALASSGPACDYDIDEPQNTEDDGGHDSTKGGVDHQAHDQDHPSSRAITSQMKVRLITPRASRSFVSIKPPAISPREAGAFHPKAVLWT